MAYERPTFEVQGIGFKLKPTSPKNLQRVRNMEEEIDLDQSEGEQYIDLLKLVAEPTSGHETDFDDLDPETVDMKKIEYYVTDFLPGLTRT